MNRAEFMSQLECLLCDVPESDRQDAVAYYNDYFDEAGPENEARIIQELGSPGRVAATIKADLRNGENEQAEYTERGYQNGHDGSNMNPPARKESSEGGLKSKRNISWPLIIVLIVFALPLLIGAGGGLLGGLLGIIFGALGIIIAAVVCSVVFVVVGAICFVVGIIRTIVSPLEGLLTIAIGSLLVAVGLLLIVLFAWCVFKWLPALFRIIVNWCQKILHRSERRSNL